MNSLRQVPEFIKLSGLCTTLVGMSYIELKWIQTEIERRKYTIDNFETSSDRVNRTDLRV